MRLHPAILTLGALVACHFPPSPAFAATPGTLTLAGTLSLGAYNTLFFTNSQTIAGSGAILFQDQVANAIILAANATTLTIGSGITIRGGSSSDFSAQIGSSPYYPSGSDISILNQGTISADTPGTHLSILPTGTGSFFNSGVIQVLPGAVLGISNFSGSAGSINNAGVLNLAGSLTLASLGNFIGNGGTVNITGNLVGNLPLSPATGTFRLLGGTLTSGTLTASGGSALLFSGSSCAFSSVTANAPIDLTPLATVLTITGNLALNAPCTLGQSSAMVFSGNQVLSSTGTTITLQNLPGNALALTGSNPSLIISPGITIHGGSSFVNSAIIGASPLFTPPINASITNQGVIAADTPGADIYIRPAGTGSFINSGTISATAGSILLVNNILGATGTVIVNNGILNLGGTFTQPGLGALSRTGGTINLTGNIRGGLALGPSTGSWNLLGGTLTAGTLSAISPAKLVFTNFGGTLSNIIAATDLDLSATSAQLTITSGLTLNATARLGSFAAIFFSGSQSLSGAGTITLQNQPANALVLTSASVLTLGPGILVHGGSSSPDAAQIGQSSFFTSASNTALINQGTIAADSPASQITINPSGGSFTNLGTLQATAGGSLVLFGQTLGSGNILVDANSFLISDGLLANSLAITGSVAIRPSSSSTGTSRLSSLSLAKNSNTYIASLDLANNKLILEASSPDDKTAKVASLASALKSGSNGGTWTGKGISSSSAAALPQQYALGLFDNSLLALSTFGGQPVDSSSLLVSIAHLGDANMNGIVDIQDQSIVTNHWQSAQSTWSAGDLNLDGFVDLQDLTLVTNNWQKTSSFTTSPAPLAPMSQPIPEPFSIALLFPAILLLSRRAPNARFR